MVIQPDTLMAPTVNTMKTASMWISSAAEETSVYCWRPLIFCVSYTHLLLLLLLHHVFVLQPQARDPFSNPATKLKYVKSAVLSQNIVFL